MLYKDQLVLTGKLNDVGNYTRVNVPHSYRTGIEMQGAYHFNKFINATANLSISSNKIKSFTEYLDNYDNGLQDSVFAPSYQHFFFTFMRSIGFSKYLPLKKYGVQFLYINM